MSNMSKKNKKTESVLEGKEIRRFRNKDVKVKLLSRSNPEDMADLFCFANGRLRLHRRKGLWQVLHNGDDVEQVHGRSFISFEEQRVKDVHVITTHPGDGSSPKHDVTIYLWDVIPTEETE